MALLGYHFAFIANLQHMESEHIQIVCDNVVLRDDGALMLVESMFSSKGDLASNTGELLARLHPVKRRLYDRISSGAPVEVMMRVEDGRTVQSRIHSNIQIHINRPEGGIEVLDYGSLTGRAASSATGEAVARDFDAAGQPVIRQMPDRSFRLVFCSMPPRAHPLGDKFDMEHFGEALIRSCKVPVTWEDRDVFHIDKSASAEDMRALLRFIATYRGAH